MAYPQMLIVTTVMFLMGTIISLYEIIRKKPLIPGGIDYVKYPFMKWIILGIILIGIVVFARLYYLLR